MFGSLRMISFIIDPELNQEDLVNSNLYRSFDAPNIFVFNKKRKISKRNQDKSKVLGILKISHTKINFNADVRCINCTDEL